MQISRRQALALGAGAITVAASGLTSFPVLADTPATQQMIDAFTGGKPATMGRVKLKTPEIAENGNTVPISFSVESPMTANDYVAEVLIVAEGNPRPGVATFVFSAMSGKAAASTRMRLAKTQNVVAVAKMSDGSLFMDKKTVKVTIGGCGG